MYAQFGRYPIGLLWLLAEAVTGSTQQMTQTELTRRPVLVESYGKLPLSFEANQGQADHDVKFLTHGPGYGVYLTQDSAILSARLEHAADSVLRIMLLGANAAAAISGTDELPGKSNYFSGSDPGKWHTNVPTYAAVRYAGVYPGIDLVYHGNRGLLEYDFVVAPEADPRAIDIGFEGARRLRINREGALVITLAGSEAIEPAPVVYQEIGGRRQIVLGRYVLRGRGRVGFSVPHYDRSRPLVIDPTLVYSTYVSPDYFRASTADAAGNVYMTGASSNGAFVTKLSPDGSRLVYSTHLGSGGIDQGYAIFVDASGNAYVTGLTTSGRFPITPGAFQTTFLGGINNPDAFVTKLNATGSALVFSTYLGGTNYDQGNGIGVDMLGYAYVAGFTISANFPTTPGAFQTAHGGSEDAFVTKLNPTGTALVYSTYLGGSGDDAGAGIAVDTSGSAYVTGETHSTNFPKTQGAFQTATRAYGVFITKLNATGSALVYSAYIAGAGPSRMALDGGGNVYVTGNAAPDFPTTPGAFRTASSNWYNSFVTKLDATGSVLVYSTFLSGSSSGSGDDGGGIAVDGWGNAYLTGLTSSTSFPTTPNALQTAFKPSSTASYTAFFTELNATGSALLYSSYLGGTGGDDGLGIALDGSGDVYLTGQTGSSDFVTTKGAYQTTYSGGCCATFVSKFSMGAVPVTTAAISGLLGNNGWYLGPVTVTLSATAGGEPISATHYSVDGGSYRTYLAPFSIAGDGAHQLSFYSVDATGQETPQGKTINIDQTPPSISGMPAPGCTLWPPNGKMVPVATVTAADALSGLVPASFQVRGTSNEPAGAPEVSITPNGSGGYVIALQADRLGTGTGRIYMLTATATDAAGNAATVTSTCTVLHDKGQ